MRQVATQGSAPEWFRAVVVEVFHDPDALSTDDKALLKRQVSNPDFVDSMPPNTVVARVITGGHDLSDPAPSVFYPFFSSHLQLPVQPGEQIYAVYEDFQQQGTSLGKWFTRVHENGRVEDANYTHGDRRYDPAYISELRRASDRRRTEPHVPSFPNGTGATGGLSLRQEDGTNPYEQIVQQSFAAQLSEYEPVPRWIKRPQELVLQGMNNSLIMVGVDRNGPATRVSGSAQVDRTSYAGSVDIVCGRGRKGLPYDSSREPDSTSPLVIRNSRGKLEVDKAPELQNKRRNRSEGNPDFKRDAARLYVSMNTAGDKNFRTGHSTNVEEGFQYPDDTVRPQQPPATPGGIGSSYLVGKADHVRLIGRKETEPNIQGSVLLLREGQRDEDLAFIYLEGGKVQVEARKIYFGKATGEGEPYIKWSVYNDHITELKTQIKALADQVQAITTAYSEAFRNSIAIPFLPVASLASVGPTVQTSTQTVVGLVKGRIDTVNPEDAKSGKLFGE